MSLNQEIIKDFSNVNENVDETQIDLIHILNKLVFDAL